MMTKKSFLKLLRDPEVRAELGQIFLDALTWDFHMEKTDAEGATVKESRTCNVLALIAEYLPKVEGAIRGCQADSASARNRAVETRDVAGEVFSTTYQLFRLLQESGAMPAIDATPRRQIENGEPQHDTGRN